jgi:hypothetical protein
MEAVGLEVDDGGVRDCGELVLGLPPPRLDDFVNQFFDVVLQGLHLLSESIVILCGVRSPAHSLIGALNESQGTAH